MKLLILSTGIAGSVPANHPFLRMTRTSLPAGPPLQLPPLLRREKKLRLIVDSVSAALQPITGSHRTSQNCGLILATRWDGRTGILVDHATRKVSSVAELLPSTIALSLVPHVAVGCASALLQLGGPTLSISGKDSCKTALLLAAMYLKQGRPLMIATESELAPPREPAHSSEPREDFAISLLLTQDGAGWPVIGEITL